MLYVQNSEKDYRFLQKRPIQIYKLVLFIDFWEKGRFKSGSYCCFFFHFIVLTKTRIG